MPSADAPVAVVTGAAGGIGSACARRLDRDGYRLVLMGRREEPLEQLASQLGDATAFAGDVRDVARVDELAGLVGERFGRVDALVNSAGGQFHAAARDITPNGWRAVVEVNLTGTFHACRALYGLMRDSGGGAIVNMVANIWQRAAPGMAHSGAARAGVVSLTRTLALEWAPDRIRVNCVSPGLTDTPGLRAYGGDLDESAARVPLRRIGTADEMAAVTAFLLGPDAAYVTGQVIAVDGGLALV